MNDALAMSEHRNGSAVLFPPDSLAREAWGRKVLGERNSFQLQILSCRRIRGHRLRLDMLQMRSLVDAFDADMTVEDFDLVDSTGRLRQAPEGAERLVEQLQQQGAVDAVMAHKHDCIPGVARQHCRQSG